LNTRCMGVSMNFMFPGGLSEANRKLLTQLHSIDGPFDATDAAQTLSLPEQRTGRLLRNLAERGWLSRVRRGLYVTVPLSATEPSEWQADVWRAAARIYDPCYIAGWSACEHWDLTEQIFRDLMVITAKPLGYRADQIQETRVRLKVVEAWRLFGTVGVWRGAERVAVSDPARTVLDLLDDPSSGGGIRQVAEVLEEFLVGPTRESALLLDYAERLGNRSVYKRLGFLIEALGLREPELLEVAAASMSEGVVSLDPSIDAEGVRDSRWNLRVNAQIAVAS